MARYTGPVCRMCRREKEKLFLKGEKCYSDKCPITKGAKVPGQHGASRKKATGYGIQFREKQKVRRYYGIRLLPILQKKHCRWFVLQRHY